MRAEQSVRFDNISVDTSEFTLYGGKYLISVVATFGGGNVVMEMLAGDNVTYLPVHAAITANGLVAVDLPPGRYRFNLTTATAVYSIVTRIPGE